MNSKILFFSAPWCGPCNAMKKMLTDEVIKDINLEIIDISSQMCKATKYQVMNVPTFVKVIDDKEVSRKVGSISINDLKNL